MKKDKEMIKSSANSIANIILSHGPRYPLSACMIKEQTNMHMNDVWTGLGFLMGFNGLRIKYESVLNVNSYHFVFDKDAKMVNARECWEACDGVISTIKNSDNDFMWSIGDLIEKSYMPTSKVILGLGILSIMDRLRTKYASDELYSLSITNTSWKNMQKDIDNLVKLCYAQTMILT